MGKSRSSIEFRETTENNMPGVSIILCLAILRRLFYFYSIEQCHEPCLKTLTASRYEAWTPNKRINDKTVGYAVGLFNCYMESFPCS